jgi:hypothetical protein
MRKFIGLFLVLINAVAGCATHDSEDERRIQPNKIVFYETDEGIAFNNFDNTAQKNNLILYSDNNGIYWRDMFSHNDIDIYDVKIINSVKTLNGILACVKNIGFDYFPHDTLYFYNDSESRWEELWKKEGFKESMLKLFLLSDDWENKCKSMYFVDQETGWVGGDRSWVTRDGAAS